MMFSFRFLYPIRCQSVANVWRKNWIQALRKRRKERDEKQKRRDVKKEEMPKNPLF